MSKAAVKIVERTPEMAATEALARNVSDRITVEANKTALPGTQLGISGDFFVEAITMRINRPNARTQVEYALSDADIGPGAGWVLGVSTLGVDTRLVV